MPSSMFPMTLQLAGDHERRVFATPVELEAWVGHELEGYEPFAHVSSVPNVEPYRSIRETIMNLSNAHAAARQLLSLPFDDSHVFMGQANQVQQLLHHVYLQKGLPPIDSYEVQALRDLQVQEPRTVLAALFALSRPHDGSTVQTIDPFSSLGMGLAANLRFKVDGNAATASLTHAADTVLSAINLRADETHARVLEQIRLADDAQGRSKSAWDAHNEDYAKLSASLEQKVDAKIESADKEIGDFKTAHHAEIALKEPVRFWADKAVAHRKRAFWFGVVGIVSAVGTAAAAAIWLPDLLGPIAAASAEQAGGGASASGLGRVRGAPSYYGIALAVIFSTLALWFLRILVRGYFSQTHLATDADERVAMVKTYLALMESGKAPTDTLNPVLVALFRPASDGLVKDDSMPAGLAELLSKPRG